MPVLIKDGIKHTINQAKASVLNYHFSSVFTHDKEATYTLPDMGSSPYPILPDIDINIAGVTNLLKKLILTKQLDPITFLQSCLKKWLKNSLQA